MDLDDALCSFQYSAFRFECHPVYSVPDEEEPLRRYFSGETPLPQANPAWTSYIADRRRTGRTVSRVRVIPKPITPYFRFEVECGYVWSADAGEAIVFLPREGLVTPVGVRDFWLFDDRFALAMFYFDDHSFWKTKEIEAELVSKLVEAKQRWMQEGLSLKTVLARIRRGEI